MQNQQQIPLIGIIDSHEADVAVIRSIFTRSNKVQVVGAVPSVAQLPDLMAAYPDIVLLDAGSLGDGLADILHQVHDHSPQCQVILMAVPGGPVDLGRAMRAGARGLINKPIVPTELLDYVLDVYDAEQRRFSRIEEVAKSRATQGRAGEVITVFSAKGGVGCTVLASNLAIALATNTRARVALVDFSLQFGDIAVLLNLRSAHGVHELMRSIDELDNSILDDVMVQHSSGVRVLLPPPRLDQVEEVDTAGMVAILKALRKYYDFVVVDTWHSVEEATIAIIEQSGVLLAVTTPEVPSLRNTKRLLDMLRERPDLRGKVQVVVNRFPSKSAVEMKDIESSLGVKPMATIASDGTAVTSSVNQGFAVVTKKGLATQSINQLASLLVQQRASQQGPASKNGPAPTPPGARTARR